MKRSRGVVAVLLLAGGWAMGAEQLKPTPVPDDFPRFIVPGHEKEMDSIRRLFWLHYQHAGPLIPLWDEWMPMSTLWPARGQSGAEREAMRGSWAAALSSRPVSDDGY